MPTLTSYPKADLTGTWERDEPSPVEAGSYTEPTVLGVATAGYLSADSDADAATTAALLLPEIGASGGGAITFVAATTYDGNSTYSTTHNISYPGASILADDHAELIISVQDSTPPTTSATAPGWTERVGHDGSSSFRPSVTKLYRKATGGESGSITVTLPTSSRCMIAMRIWRGVDPASPYDFVSGSMSTGDGTGNNPDPGAVTTATNGARVVVDLACNRPGGSFTATAPAGYTRQHMTSGADRQLVMAHKEVTTAGSENPGAWTTTVDNWTYLVDALKPAAAVDLTAVVITAVVDGTTTAELGGGAVPVLSGATFALDTSFQIPRTSTWRPQVHVWTANVTSYSTGATIDITVADHDSLHSWAAVLLIVQDLENGDEIEVVGGEDSGYSSAATFGAVTPGTLGSKVWAITASTPSGWHWASAPNLSGTAPTPTPPSGYEQRVLAESDAVTLAVFESSPLSSNQAQTPSQSSWSGVLDWTSGVISLQPDVPSSSTTNLYDVVNGTSVSSWIEIAAAAGNMDEVLELNLDELPSAAVVTSIKLNVTHESAVRNPIRVELVGINSDDSIVLGGEQATGYYPTSTTETSTIETSAWRELADGSDLFDYTRLGVRVFSTQRAPSLTSHKIYSVSATIEYLEGGPVVSTVVGPATAGDPITWVYSSDSGLAMTHYRVVVQNGSGQDPASPLTPANPLEGLSNGDVIFDSGQTPGNIRSLLLEAAPLARGDCTVSVRAWARAQSGGLVVSDWESSDFSITGAAPSSPTSGGAPTFDTATGSVTVSFTPPSGMSRAWLLRSGDSGVSWTIAPESPFTVSGTGAHQIKDNWAPIQSATVRYKVAVDAGANYETSIPVDVDGADVSTAHTRQPDGWYLIVPDMPTLNMPIEVADVAIDNHRNTVVVEQAGNNLAVSSAFLGSEISLGIRTRDNAARVALQAVLDSDKKIRLVDVLGREWVCRLAGGHTPGLQRWQALPTESSGLRDAHLHGITLVEVGGT